MTDDRQREKPLYLDMDPDEALERFLQTDPGELKRRFDKKNGPPKRPPSAENMVRPKPRA